jgi:heme-degrading monooxygenase HmoA
VKDSEFKKSDFLKEVNTMHARLMTGTTLPGKLDEAIGIYQDSILPAAKEQKGLKGIYLLTDPATNKFVSVTLWETEADMLAGEASGYLNEQIAKAGPTLAMPPVREAYEVSVKG